MGVTHIIRKVVGVVSLMSVAVLVGLQIWSLGDQVSDLDVPYSGYLIALLILTALWSFYIPKQTGEDKTGPRPLKVGLVSIVIGMLGYIIALLVALIATGATGINTLNSYAGLLIFAVAILTYPILRKKLD